MFDDFNWTYDSHRHKPDNDGITTRHLGREEMAQPHVERIFRLLVMQHPSFSNFTLQDDAWAWAQKSSDGRRTLVNTTKMPMPEHPQRSLTGS